MLVRENEYMPILKYNIFNQHDRSCSKILVQVPNKMK